MVFASRMVLEKQVGQSKLDLLSERVASKFIHLFFVGVESAAFEWAALVKMYVSIQG
jgi:hypothetical protein